MTVDREALARALDEAALHGRAIPQLSASADLTVEDGYAIQALAVSRRITRGERMAGIKMGFTSRAKMRQMGVDELIWGRLTTGMQLEDGGATSMARYVHPRVEPEVAFLLGRPLEGAVSPARALAAVDAVAPALELIDSRYEAFRFSLPDVVADNASASGFVVGPWRAPSTDVANLGILLEIDGRPVEIGSTAAILGHPLRSLAAAARLAGRLEAGWVVLAGGATAAVALKAGQHVRVVAERLGQAGFTITA